MKITRYSGEEGIVMSAEDDLLDVYFTNCKEGCSGDYDEDDPDDENLLRVTVNIYDEEEGDWREVDDASYCTLISADMPADILEEKLTFIFNEYKKVAGQILAGESVEELSARLSFME